MNYIQTKVLNWGFKLIKEKKISNMIQKIFFTFAYIIFGTTFINMFYDKSYWLIDNGNGGFVGSSIKENFYLVSNLSNNQYFIFTVLF